MIKLGVLLCDEVREELISVDGTYKAMFQRLFAPHTHDVELLFYRIDLGELPHHIHECDAYTSSGSHRSVYEDEPWIHAFKELLVQFHQQKIPFFGVCFGHQMIAHALGGKVGLAPQGWGVGLHEITILKEKEWMQPIKNTLKIIVSHKDQILKIPEQAETLASSPHCPVSMIKCGSLTGIQGHPEYLAEFARPLMLSRRKDIPEGILLEADKSLSTAPDQELLVQWILQKIKVDLHE